MNHAIEEKFAKAFLEKRISKRIIIELQSSTRREHAINRFCHSSESTIKASCIHKKTKDVKILYSTISTLSTSKKCYVISSIREIDGTEISLESALNLCIGFGGPSILIIDESIAVVETEQEYGPSMKYVLHKKA